MNDLRAILSLEHAPFEFNGVKLQLRRPTLLDLVEAHEANQRDGAHSRAWAIQAHLLDMDGNKVFASVDAALACPAALAAAAFKAIEALYSEGSD